METRERERRWLKDPMGPRRWAITGLCFVAVGALIHALHEPSRATSGPLIMVGALFALAGFSVGLVLRVRMKAEARRANPRG
jgi:hypothetical protein